MFRRLHLRASLDELKSSLWFRPAVITVLSAILAVVSLSLDQHYQFKGLPFLNPGVDDARSILTSITSSMLTVTSVTFSIIMVALVLGSQQFSPRILRNFMRDTASQYVMGIFIGTYMFSLLVLGRVTDTKNIIFVPTVSLFMSIVLSTLSIGSFIFFIHHIAERIQANNIISHVAHETIELMHDRFPETLGLSFDDEEISRRLPDAPAGVLGAPKAGYVQAIDPHRLLKLAIDQNLVLKLERSIGDFVPHGNPLLRFWPERALPLLVVDELADCFEIGNERTMFEDVLFGLRQLVDIAVKALSPAVNDPTTAGNCVDYLGNVLVHAARLPDPATFRYDSERQLRVVVQGVTFAEMLDMAFNQIRQYAANDVAVTLRLLTLLGEIAFATNAADRHAVIWRHVRMITRAADHGIHEPCDRAEINKRVYRLAELLDRPPGRALLTVDEELLRD